MLYFKKYNPKSRIESLNIDFTAIKDFKEQLRKSNGITYSLMDYPDIFGALSPKSIEI